MRLTNTVDSLSGENRFLRNLVKTLAFLIFMLLGLVVHISDQPTMLVQQTNRGLTFIKATEYRRSKDDLDIAVAEMIRARFDSAAVNPELFLSQKQFELRNSEQKELNSRNLFQSIIFRSVKVSKDEALVEFDRVLSVGDIRSALKTILKIAFSEVSPNIVNPYGLVLSLANPISKKEEK